MKHRWIIGSLVWVLAARGARAGMFPDVPPNHWAYQAVRELSALGLVEGYPDGTFKGSQPITRYEVALMVQRVLERLGVLEALEPAAEAPGALRLRRPRPPQWEKLKQAPPGVRERLERLLEELAPELRELGVELPELSPTEPLDLSSLDRLTAWAVHRNPELQALGYRLLALTEAIPAAGTLDDPLLGVQFSNLPLGRLAFNRTPMTGLQLLLMQKFPARGKLALREEATAQAAVATAALYEDKAREIIGQVKQTYYELAYLDRAIQITEANRDLLREFAKLAETKYSVGKGLQQDVLRAQVAVSHILDDLIKLRQRRITVQAQLNTLLYRPPQAPVGAPGELTETPFDREVEELQQLALRVRPLLKYQQHTLAQMDTRMHLARKDLKPDFTVSLGYRFREALAMDPVAGEDFLTLGVTANLPVRTGRKQWPLIRAAEAQREQAQRTLEALRNTIQFKISDLVARLQQTHDQIELFSTGLIPQAELSLASARAGYMVDKVDFITLLNNQIALFNFQIGYYRALADHEKALAELEFVVGRRLEEMEEAEHEPEEG
ncbi:MAG TPA: hypothetical protein EYP85_13065 [Armatimonadetes bacterium]|nr:hypothetical protein [Armatimonadota bacterium]